MGEWVLIEFTIFLLIAVRVGIGFLNSIKLESEISQTDPQLRKRMCIRMIERKIHSCLSGLFIMPASQVAMILIAGWTLSLSEVAPVQDKPKALTNTLLVIALLLTSAVLVFATKEISRPQDQQVQREPTYRTAPRFWQDGKACGPHRAHFFE